MLDDDDETDASKISAMETLINKAGISSINTFIGRTSFKNSVKEPPEYEGKSTEEILTPELTLGRLGYAEADNINWTNVSLPEKKNLYLELYSRITNYTNADCKVYIDNEEFNCHLIVLQCYSDLFDAYIAVKKVELPADRCTPAAFAFIYQWMITGEPSYKNLTRENVLDIFMSAKYLKIKDLVEQCWAFIDNPAVFSEDTAFILYMNSKKKNLPEVRELMMPRIEDFFFLLVSSHDWLELDVEDVKHFLTSNYIRINCEIEIFMSAVRWLKHDWVRRDIYRYEVIECVRFGNIAPWQLVDIKRNPDNPEFLELAKDPRICKLIDDGLAYVIIKYWYGHENNDFQHWNAILGLQTPPTRNWTGTDRYYTRYREFLIFLDQYRRSQIIKNKQKRLASKDANDLNESERKFLNEAKLEERTPSRMPTMLPTMDEFMSKKKKKVSISSKLTSYCENESSQSSIEPISTKCRAAVIIQRAYRRYRKKQLFEKLDLDVVKKSRQNQILATKDVLNRFCMSKTPFSKQSYASEVTINSSKRDLLEIGSLFHKLRETILVFGGIDSQMSYGTDKNTGKDIYRYMPLGNCWEFVGELPEPRYQHCTEFYKGKVFLAGGSDPSAPKKEDNKVKCCVWSFDPVTRRWFQESPMLEARKNFGLVSCNKGLYAIGGQGNQYQTLDSVERFDVEKNTWEKVCSMRTARTGFGYTRFKNSIWVAGGLTERNNTIDILDSMENYDYKTNQWTEINYSLRFPRCFFSLCVQSEKLYVIGGASKGINEEETFSVGSVEYWDNQKFEWKKLNELNIPRHGHVISYLGTQIFIIGGVTTMYNRALSNVECFCCQRETWVRGLACLPTSLSGHSAATLPPVSFLPC